jgi:hypothetical protein
MINQRLMPKLFVKARWAAWFENFAVIRATPQRVVDEHVAHFRYWHIADYFSRLAECLLSGVKRTLFHTA